MVIKIRLIEKEENQIHNYEIPAEDSFAHLEIQVKFSKLSDEVKGILGNTYKPDYVSLVKVGVLILMMGGEDKYETQTLYCTLCRACRFQRRSTSNHMEGRDEVVAQY